MNKSEDSVDSPVPGDIRLLVLDIDGTILDESDQIRASVAHAVQAAQHRGVAVAIATGRLYQSALRAYSFVGSTAPLICYEGALVREPATGFVHRHWALDREVAAQILDHTERLSRGGRISVQFHIQDSLYMSNMNRASTAYFEGSGLQPVVVDDLRQLLHREITKVTLLSEDAELMAQLATRLQGPRCRTVTSQYRSLTLLDVFHPMVNKRLAVSYLAEEVMGLRSKNVMTIGDDFTDIELFKYAGVGVAMGNSPVAVKAFANWITSTIEENGVAEAIERWIPHPISNLAEISGDLV
jgi:Cof subfamily protein (haloacid dehalogenase superfamily)